MDSIALENLRPLIGLSEPDTSEQERETLEERLSLILHHVKDIVFLLAVEAEETYRFEFINQPFLTVTGLSREQIIGQRIQEVIPAPAQTLVLGKYAEAIRERRAVEWQEISVYPLGERIGEVRVIPIFDEQDRCTHVLGTVHDITGLRQAQERSDQLFALSTALGGAITTAQVADAIIQAAFPIFQARMGLVALLSEDGARLDCERIVGVPVEEADHWRSFPTASRVPLADAVRERRLVLLDTDEAHNAAYPDMAATRTVAGEGALVAVPLLIGGRCIGGIGLICPPERCRDEEQQTFLWTLAGQCALSLEQARLFDAERRARAEALAEVAERRRAEAALRESEERLRLALEGGKLGIWHWDLATGAVDWPPATKALFGLPPDAPTERESLLEMLHPDDRQRVREAMQAAMDGGRDYATEYRILRPDGSLHWIASRGRVHRDSQGRATSMEGVLEDVTERREIAEREHRIAEQLQAALQPMTPDSVPGLELAAYYRPALEDQGVGGDFSDVFSVDKGVTFLVVGDLSGKGLAAASQVAMVRHMLRFALYNGRTVAGPVTSLNATLADNNLLDGFTTLFVGRYDAQSRTLTYVNCGQDAGLVLRSSTGNVESLPPTGPVLGTISGVSYTQETVTLEADDALALYTDGLTEAGPTRQELLTGDGVAALLEKQAGQTDVRGIADALIAGVDAYAGQGVRDDQCLLVAVAHP